MTRPNRTKLDELAEFAAGLDGRTLPTPLVEQAKALLLDALSAAVTFASHPRSLAALAAVSHDQADHVCHILGSSHLASPPDAALVNGVTTAATGRMDTDPLVATHPGTVVVPAVLAVAEQMACDGATVLAALVAGYEVMFRLGAALITPETARIFRPTSLAGPTAAAIGAARALKLSPSEIANAGSLAAHTSGGLNEWAYAGTNEGAFQSGFAARNGVTAALLARAGATSAPSILEGPAGLLAGHGRRAQAHQLTEGLGQVFAMRALVHKPAPACVYVQTPCQVAQGLVASLGIDVAQISEIHIGVSAAAAAYPGCDNAGPIRTQQEARMSIQFSVAAVFVNGGIVDSNWSDSPDLATNALAARCRLAVDQRSPKQSGGGYGCWIELLLADGRKVRGRQEEMRTLEWADLRERFLVSAAPVIGSARAGEAVSMVENMENLNSILRLTGQMTPAPHAAASVG